jgi:hypothetical protein
MAKESARLGHDVLVLTQTEFKGGIKRECATGALPRNIRFEIFMPSWLERLRDVGLDLGLTSLTWHVVSIAWQFCALAHVRRHYKSAEFDLGHHVSLSGVRHPWMHGPPVICLSLGGPGEMVDEASGCVVSATGRSEEECVAALGSEIVELAKNECRRQQLARGALARSRTYTWSRVAASIYAEIEQCLGRDAAAGSRAPVSRQVAMEARPCVD